MRNEVEDSGDHLILSPVLVPIHDQLDPSLCLVGVSIVHEFKNPFSCANKSICHLTGWHINHPTTSTVPQTHAGKIAHSSPSPPVNVQQYG